MNSFWALLSRPAHLITPDAGTHEFTKVYFVDGAFNLGRADGRLGGQPVLASFFEPAEGLTVRLQDYMIFVPTHLVTANWKR